MYEGGYTQLTRSRRESEGAIAASRTFGCEEAGWKSSNTTLALPETWPDQAITSNCLDPAQTLGYTLPMPATKFPCPPFKKAPRFAPSPSSLQHTKKSIVPS